MILSGNIWVGEEKKNWICHKINYHKNLKDSKPKNKSELQEYYNKKICRILKICTENSNKKFTDFCQLTFFYNKTKSYTLKKITNNMQLHKGNTYYVISNILKVKNI